MLPQPLWFYVCTILVTSGRHRFLRANHHLWHLTSVCLLFYICPWALRGGLDEDIPCRTECFKVLHSAHYPVVSLLVLIYCKKLPWWELSEAQIYENSNVSLGVTLLLRSCSKITTLDFPLGPWTIFCQVFGHLSRVRYGFYLVKLAIKSNQKVVNYSYNICATTVPEYLVSRSLL